MKGIEQRKTKRSGKQRRKQISSLEAAEMNQVKSSIAYCGVAVPLQRKNTEVLVSGKIWKQWGGTETYKHKRENASFP